MEICAGNKRNESKSYKIEYMCMSKREGSGTVRLMGGEVETFP